MLSLRQNSKTGTFCRKENLFFIGFFLPPKRCVAQIKFEVKYLVTFISLGNLTSAKMKVVRKLSKVCQKFVKNPAFKERGEADPGIAEVDDARERLAG